MDGGWRRREEEGGGGRAGGENAGTTAGKTYLDREADENKTR